MDAFFNLRYRGNHWFDDLEISEHHEYDVYRNSFPVVLIDLKDTVPVGANGDYNMFVQCLLESIRETMIGFKYLMDSDLVDEDSKKDMADLINRNVNEARLSKSIRTLCSMLEAHHGRKVVVLIDEYDRAITDTFGSDLQEQIIGFMSQFMSSTLKGNPSLQFAYVTGVMQVAKAGMFSGVKNLVADNLFSKRSDERFGFTDNEVRSILDYYEHPEKMDEVKEWYDGYRFGDTEVYNPFSLMSYISLGFEPLGYWANSGNDRTDLYSLMVMTGYLKAVPRDDGLYDISVPNKEVRMMVDHVLDDVVPVDDSLFRDFAVAVQDGDGGTMETLLAGLLDGSSYFDLRDESDYKLALFLCLHGIVWHYDVECERKGGNGRLDIIMRPRDDTVRPVIIEVKVSKDESSLTFDAEDGIHQIHRMRYYNGMSGEILLYGISFWGVVPKVVTERIVI